MKTEQSEYIEAKSGKRLIRCEAQFYLNGRTFHGLIVDNNLYDDPNDSFAKVTGIQSSLDKGLIVKHAL